MWLSFDFMQWALLAVILITPVLALLGTFVIRHHLTFFSDIVGHSSLTGIALGLALGLAEPTPAMIGLAIVLAVLVSLLQKWSRSSVDMSLGVLFSLMTSLGVVLLSQGGGFSKFTSYLIGDILTITPSQLVPMFFVCLVIVAMWVVLHNAIVLISINPLLARSRRIPVFLVETCLTSMLAVMVTLSVQWVGVLVVNSLLILPAATARPWAKNARQYAILSVLLGVFSGVIGLIGSFYWGSATGATIALVGSFFFALSLLLRAVI
jgi:zinc transport system permease protein